MSFCKRSAPAYRPTSAAVAPGLIWLGAEIGSTAPAANRPAMRVNLPFMIPSIGVLPDLLTFEEKPRPKFLPPVGLTERNRGIDHLERECIEAPNALASSNPRRVLTPSPPGISSLSCKESLLGLPS